MAGDGDRQRMTLVLAAMTAANAMILVDQTAVPLALPDIMKTFGVGSQEVQWVLNGSLLPLAGLLVFGGRLGDLVGRRRVFVAGAVVFVTASAIGGLAPDFYVLLAARVAQGVGGALMLPTTVAIVNSTFPPDARGRALGTMGGAAAVFGALGPTIGGSLTSVFSWRAVLLINVPLALVAVLLALRYVPADEDAAEERERIDARRHRAAVAGAGRSRLRPVTVPAVRLGERRGDPAARGLRACGGGVRALGAHGALAARGLLAAP